MQCTENPSGSNRRRNLPKRKHGPSEQKKFDVQRHKNVETILGDVRYSI